MLKLQRKNAETAQGMVEFALVLPILLMVIMGVFAFGHLFFVYSTLVSASREAARFGSAVGNTAGGLPRYKDCNEIIAAAVNIGKFAGVTEDNVTITYDDGPDDTNTADNGKCIKDHEGPEVDLGDRIKVDINVMYTPIVPLVPIPSFNLNGQTNRTIVKDLAVGDSPDAEDPCLTQTKIDSFTIDPEKTVGATVIDAITFTASVVTVNPAAGYNNPAGKIKIEAVGLATPLLCEISIPGSNSCTTKITVEGTYDITATFVPLDVNSCYLASAPVTVEGYKISQPSGEMTLAANPASGALEGDEVIFYVTVPTGQFITGGSFTVTDTGEALYNCSSTLDVNGKGSCKFKPPAGDRVIEAKYQTPSGTTLTATLNPYTVKAVTPETTITTISDTPDPSEPGKPVTITVTVAPSAVGVVATPTGSVSVVLVGTGQICSLALNNGSASCSYTFSADGDYTLRAIYSPNTVAFSASTSADEPHTVKTTLVCPTASKIVFAGNNGSYTSFSFNIKETNPGVTITKIVVNHYVPSNENDPKLTYIYKKNGSNSTNTLFHDGGGAPRIVTVTAFANGADLAMTQNAVQSFTFKYKSALYVAGVHEVNVYLSNTCVVTASSQ